MEENLFNFMEAQNTNSGYRGNENNSYSSNEKNEV